MNPYGILTPEERETIIRFITERAPDDLLMDFGQQLKQFQQALSDSRIGLKGYLGIGKIVAPSVPVEAPKVLLEAVTEKVVPIVDNVEPRGEAATRVTSKTQDLVMRHLTKGPDTPEAINRILNGTQKNTDSVLKLLWKRNHVVFVDGKFARA